MAVINGASVVQENRNETDVRYDIIGKNSEVFAVGDPVTVASGVLKVAGATDTIVGYAVKAQTMASNNQTVAPIVYPGYVPVDNNTIFLMGSNGDFTGNATDAGTYYKLTGTTGAVQVDQASGVQTGANRIVEIVKVDPFGDGGSGSGSGLRTLFVRFVKTPYTNVQITT